MKMIFNGTPVSSMKVKHYEMSTNDATVVPSDLQAGITCYARGQKVTGTGKSFEFASYGEYSTNAPIPIPTEINVLGATSVTYPLQSAVQLANTRNIDFSIEQNIGNIIIDGTTYALTAKVEYSMLTITCQQTIKLELFFGKDNYV